MLTDTPVTVDVPCQTRLGRSGPETYLTRPQPGGTGPRSKTLLMEMETEQSPSRSKTLLGRRCLVSKTRSEHGTPGRCSVSGWKEPQTHTVKSRVERVGSRTPGRSSSRW
jgi:hypothetical protein